MDYLDAQPQLIPYLPIATTVLSVAFCGILFRRFGQHGGAHLLWWGGGVFCSQSSPTLLRCVITDNSVINESLGGGFGGGIYCFASSPHIENSQIGTQLPASQNSSD